MALRSLLSKFAFPLSKQLSRMEDRFIREIERNRILAAQPLIRELKRGGILENLVDAEFKVFSQWGEDGILQYLISKINIKNKVFIEFGVQDYKESNTRFLLVNNDWTGVVIDASKEHVEYIRAQEYYWRHDLTAVCSFITAENINTLIEQGGVTGSIGLLSIDIDGNDYWIWNAVSITSPQIVIVEYNSSFADQHAVTIPYHPDFQREKAHYSHLYWGASLPAFIHLASQKNYTYVGSNAAGSNAFFVRNDSLGGLGERDFHKDFTQSKFSDARDENGDLSFVRAKDKLKVIKDMPLFDVETNQILKIKDIYIKELHE